MIFGNFMILSICTQLCSHTACSLLVILQGALQKESFFYVNFNSQNNIGSMRRYPELISGHGYRIYKIFRACTQTDRNPIIYRFSSINNN